MHSDRCGNTCGQKCHAKRSGKKPKILEFMYRDTKNVKHEIYETTGNNWRHCNSNKWFKEKSGNHNRKTFNRFTTKDSHTRNVTHNVLQCCSLKREG